MKNIILTIIATIIVFELIGFLAHSFGTNVENFCCFVGAALTIYVLVKPKLA